MKTAALAREMRDAFAAMDDRDIEELVQLGVPEILISHFQMVGLARVREFGSQRYYPDPRGRLVFVTPVCVHHKDTPESTRPDAFPLIGNLVDLVAWDERAPNEWRLRTGEGHWLGAIGPQYLNPEPVPIRRSPLSWLQNRCIGLVPLSPDPAEIRRVLSFCARPQVRGAREDVRYAA
jgi:hypothetical protein